MNSIKTIERDLQCSRINAVSIIDWLSFYVPYETYKNALYSLDLTKYEYIDTYQKSRSFQAVHKIKDKLYHQEVLTVETNCTNINLGNVVRIKFENIVFYKSNLKDLLLDIYPYFKGIQLHFKISRLDYALDVDEDLTKQINLYFSSINSGALIPRYDGVKFVPYCSSSSEYFNSSASTWYLSKGENLKMKIYNKTKELEHSKKEYISIFHQKNGIYNSVTRFEVTLNSEYCVRRSYTLQTILDNPKILQSDFLLVSCSLLNTTKDHSDRRKDRKIYSNFLNDLTGLQLIDIVKLPPKVKKDSEKYDTSVIFNRIQKLISKNVNSYDVINSLVAMSMINVSFENYAFNYHNWTVKIDETKKLQLYQSFKNAIQIFKGDKVPTLEERYLNNQPLTLFN